MLQCYNYLLVQDGISWILFLDIFYNYCVSTALAYRTPRQSRHFLLFPIISYLNYIDYEEFPYRKLVKISTYSAEKFLPILQFNNSNGPGKHRIVVKISTYSDIGCTMLKTVEYTKSSLIIS